MQHVIRQQDLRCHGGILDAHQSNTRTVTGGNDGRSDDEDDDQKANEKSYDKVVKAIETHEKTITHKASTERT